VTVRQQLIGIGIIVAALSGGLAAADWAFHRDLDPVAVGARAPTFRAMTLGAPPRLRTSADYRGQVVLLNVWTTWCEPCRVEMPSLETLYRTYGPRGLRIVAVSVDEPGHAADIRAFAHQFGLTFDVLYDTAGQIEQAYQTTGYPESFVIARDGVIRKRVGTAEDWASPDNQALFADLLTEPAPRGGR
jgi:peroxiredoxin